VALLWRIQVPHTFFIELWTKLGIVLAVSNPACYNFKLHDEIRGAIITGSYNRKSCSSLSDCTMP
jgi:hypothetical protein